MDKPSRKQLEVEGSNTFYVKDKLKELGCEWDAIARKWIAPTIEVKELCEDIAESYDGITYQGPGCLGFDEDFYSDSRSWDEIINEPVEQLKNHPPVVVQVTKQDIERIIDTETFARYYREEAEEKITEILASGAREKTYREELEDAGFDTRQISLIRDVVIYYREHGVVNDSFQEIPETFATKTRDKVDTDGKISVAKDRTKTLTAIAISFPYSHLNVNKVKWIRGSKWDGGKKQWLVPPEEAEDVAKTFPCFQRSEGFAKLIQADGDSNAE